MNFLFSYFSLLLKHCSIIELPFRKINVHDKKYHLSETTGLFTFLLQKRQSQTIPMQFIGTNSAWPFSNAESSQDRAPTYINQNYPIPLSLKSALQAGQNYPLTIRTAQPRAYPVQTQSPDRRALPSQQHAAKGEEVQVSGFYKY